MKPGYGLELVQTQKLILTPELRQALTVLQMNALELRDYVKEEVEKNPLLEMDEESRREPLDEGIREPLVDDESDDQGNSREEWLDYFSSIQDIGLPREHAVVRNSDESPIYENVASQGIDLKDYLMSQIGLLDLTPDEYRVAEYIVGSIDDNGYLRSSVAEIALATGQPEVMVEKMVNTVQKLDPPGVGARDLRECLLIQAHYMHLSDLAIEMIKSHLSDLAEGRYSKIAQKRKVSVEDVLRARDEILKLDPKPGARFSCDNVPYVVPDVVVKRTGENLVVMLNDNVLPVIRWNSLYTGLMRDLDEDARSYLSNQFQRARSLLKNIERRKATISRVMDCIIRKQREFFLKGPLYLEPLSLKDVAEEIGVHESTVSRAISNKYVDTPFGVFPCKVFFNSKIHGQSGDISGYSVKKYIQDLIKGEDPRKPYSDEEISLLLSKKGIKIARRTVVKYRQELGIPASSRRKQA